MSRVEERDARRMTHGKETVQEIVSPQCDSAQNSVLCCANHSTKLIFASQ